MEKLKFAFNPKSVRALAQAIKQNYPIFEGRKFSAFIEPKLNKLELKDRVRLISKALQMHLPAEPRDSLPIILLTIESPKNPNGISGFQAWPFTQFVEDSCLNHPELALPALKEITAAMSAEFAIRPFLIEHEKLTLEILSAWVSHENKHVRRLVSEGTRPRLPWGQRIPRFQENPQLCLKFLRALRLDDEIYVRKSVANHLNDFSKDHPDWLVKELSNWQKEFPDHEGVRWIIRHACRSLIKAGHPGALQLQGIKPAKIEKSSLSLNPKILKLGGTLEISFSAEAGRSEKWLIDYAVHHRKSNGGLKPKVFKWAQKTMRKGERLQLMKKHKIIPISTRKYYAGEHELEIFVNGQPAAKKAFTLNVPKK